MMVRVLRRHGHVVVIEGSDRVLEDLQRRSVSRGSHRGRESCNP